MGFLGGKQDVTHENSHEIQGVAKFAVEEISKQTVNRIPLFWAQTPELLTTKSRLHACTLSVCR